MMQVKFWGVRGSIPTPIPPDALESKMVDLLVSASGQNLSTPEAARVYLRSLPVFQRSTIGGNTTCIEVKAEGHRLIIDMGSGLKELGWSLMREEFGSGKGDSHILISHTHWDHIMGFPFFVPFFIPGNRFTICGCHTRLKQRFRHQHHPDNFPFPLDNGPIQADIRFRKLPPEKKVQLGPFTVYGLLLDHPGDAYAYRIEYGGRAFVCATDASYNNLTPEHMEKYHSFYKDADAFVFDAFFALVESFEKSDWGHSSSFIGVDIALYAGIKRLVLFHHAPISDDQRLQHLLDSTQKYLNHVAPNTNCEVLLAYEGLELDL